MQSWGVSSRYGSRDTLDHPSKSGVIGLCAAALGRRRDESIADLAALRYGVLVVDPGQVAEDYQTVSNVLRAKPARRVDLSHRAVVRTWGAREIARAKLPRAGDTDGGLKRTEVTRRLYLADAFFIAGLEGPRALLDSIKTRLDAPVFPLSLGRASCMPSAPIAFRERADGGLCEGPLEPMLRALSSEVPTLLSERHVDRRERARRLTGVRLICECDPNEATIRVQDQPDEFAFSRRRFFTRFSRALPIEVGDA